VSINGVGADFDRVRVSRISRRYVTEGDLAVVVVIVIVIVVVSVVVIIVVIIVVVIVMVAMIVVVIVVISFAVISASSTVCITLPSTIDPAETAAVAMEAPRASVPICEGHPN
jgi:hypothetical protein